METKCGIVSRKLMPFVDEALFVLLNCFVEGLSQIIVSIYCQKKPLFDFKKVFGVFGSLNGNFNFRFQSCFGYEWHIAMYVG
jgi:hypothetical protein